MLALIALLAVATAAPSAPPQSSHAMESPAPGRAHTSPQTAVTDFLSAPPGEVLWADEGSGDPHERALAFLAERGDLIGLNSSEMAAAATAVTTGAWPSGGAELRLDRVETDAIGQTHVRFDQYHSGVRVYAGHVFVHLTDEGVAAVNGDFIPGVDLGEVPALSAQKAAAVATGVAEAVYDGPDDFAADVPELLVYRTGLVEGRSGENVLAYEVPVRAPDAEELVYVDATTGRVLLHHSRFHSARDRCTYTPTYQEDAPEAGRVRTEDDGLGRGVVGNPPDDLHAFAAHVYDFFANAFERDSWTGDGAKMISVYLIDAACPNAFWNGTSTNYCPGFDIDDVVAHEWGHAYTEKTHGLIYAYQSGALNESYSDIWGETVDLINGEDGIGGSNNDDPYPDGQRWIMGEDLTEPVVDLLLRDMWDPERLGYPAKVSSENYACDTGDQGGVHHNSGVPNHTYAIIVDGKEFNGQTVRGIGLTKAAHIYYRAMTVYQGPSTQFDDHANALLASCADLTGQPLRSITDGSISGETITADDCEQVEAAVLATELLEEPVQCGFQPLLITGEPKLCPGADAIFEEDWEDGLDGWTTASNGVFPISWPGFEWEAVNELPNEREGTAAYAIDDVKGTCQPGGDYSGNFTLDSPTISIPEAAPNLAMRFNHFMSNEFFWDGGNVKLSVNGGDFQVVPQGNYDFNEPPFQLNGVADQNTNPLAGEWAFTGIEPDGAEWVTSIIDLTGLVEPGDELVIRFDFGMDGCNGIEGWYVDEVLVYACALLEPPDIALGDDYEDPDTDGRFTAEWERPQEAVGPDSVEVSDVAPTALTSDGSTLDGWTVDSDEDGPEWSVTSEKPNADNPTFGAVGSAGAVDQTTTLTTAQPIVLPDGATGELRYTDWYSNEGDDVGAVEVSIDGGESWEAVSTITDSASAAEALVAFQTEEMTPRLADLTEFAGEETLLRFRYTLGAEDRASSTPFGWFVDDIEVTVDAFRELDSVAAMSLLVAAPEGTRWYRARAGYDFDGESALGPPGNVVAATSLVDGTAPSPGAGSAPPPAPEPEPAPLPTTGGGAALIGALALAVGARRSSSGVGARPKRRRRIT